MNHYQSFVFRDYQFDAETQTLRLDYGYDESLTFTETIGFNFPFVAYNPEVLDRALQNLFFMAGVSYYKMYLAPHIVINQGTVDATLAQFLSETYQYGLGEFLYINKLDVNHRVPFPVTQGTALSTMPASTNPGMLVGLGGGKDSLVSVELLRQKHDVITWSVGHQRQLEPLVQRIGLPHHAISRSWDPQLLEHNARGAYNGHVPISAILACIGTVAAILSGTQDVVVSNENSANEPTLTYQGRAINHQYSKSLAFEQSYQAILHQQFGDTLRYYSLLRPVSELRITELFAGNGFGTYHDVFSSCNRAFVHTSSHMSWCGECPKCAFVCLALTPFVPEQAITAIWGRSLLLDASLDTTYRNLLGIMGDKPLECVGEIKESRAAMRLATDRYPELAERFVFDIPNDYNWRELQPHAMPNAIYRVLEPLLTA